MRKLINVKDLEGKTPEQIVAEVNAQLSAAAPKGQGGFKIGDKGSVSVYGMGRFPTTLYRSQWLQLFDRIDELKAFIEVNKEKLDAVDARRQAEREEAKAA